MATHKFLIALLWPTCILVTGCETTRSAFDNDCKVSGTTIGAVVGGVAGGLLFGKGQGKIGSAFLGAAAGAFVGNQLGALLDCNDQRAVDTAGQKAAEAPVGERVVWASTTTQVPTEAADTAEIPATVPKSGATPPQPSAVKKAPVKTSAPAKPSESTPGQGTTASGKWTAVEPVRSGGNSGMWGWVEPVSDPKVAADGKTCRDIRQVAVDKAGAQHAETVTSCRGADNRWAVVASAS